MLIDKYYVFFFFGIAVVLIGITSRLLYCLKRNHESLYIRIGSPSATDNSPTKIFRFWKWIYSNISLDELSIEEQIHIWVLRYGAPIYLLGFLMGAAGVFTPKLS